MAMGGPERPKPGHCAFALHTCTVVVGAAAQRTLRRRALLAVRMLCICFEPSIFAAWSVEDAR